MGSECLPCRNLTAVCAPTLGTISCRLPASLVEARLWVKLVKNLLVRMGWTWEMGRALRRSLQSLSRRVSYVCLLDMFTLLTIIDRLLRRLPTEEAFDGVHDCAVDPL